MFGGQATGSLGFGQQTNNASMSLGGAFGQQPQSGTGNPPFDPTKVKIATTDFHHYYFCLFFVVLVVQTRTIIQIICPMLIIITYN